MLDEYRQTVMRSCGPHFRLWTLWTTTANAIKEDGSGAGSYHVVRGFTKQITEWEA